jgi:hypothetical protein
MLRSICILSVDSGKHNVLYDPPSRKVTLIDFEAVEDLRLGEQATVSFNHELAAICVFTGMSVWKRGP